MSIYLPIRDTNQVVELPIKNSFNIYNYVDIRDLLKREICPLDVWIRTAIEFYRNGYANEFEELLLEAERCANAAVYNNSDICKNYLNEDDSNENTIEVVGGDRRIRVCTTLAFYHMNTAFRLNKEKQKQEAEIRKAEELVRKAEYYAGIHIARKKKKKKQINEINLQLISKRDPNFLAPSILGFLLLCECVCTDMHISQKNKFISQANNVFCNIIKSNNEHILSRLGIAAINVHMKRWDCALEEYTYVLYCIIKHNNFLLLSSKSESCCAYAECPAFVLYAIGVCFFYTNQLEKALKCFELCVERNDSDVNALSALCCLLNTNVGGVYTLSNVERSISLLKEAAALSPSNINILLQIANYEFLCGNLANAEKILNFVSEEVNNNCFASSSVILLGGINSDLFVRSEIYFQLGRIFHKKSNYFCALSNYQKSLDIRSNHVACRFHIAQCCVYFNLLDEANKHLKFMCTMYPYYFDTLKLHAYVLILSAEDAAKNPFPSDNPQDFRNNEIKHDKTLMENSAKQIQSFYLNALNALNEAIKLDESDEEILILKINAYEGLIQQGDHEFFEDCLESYKQLHKILQDKFFSNNAVDQLSINTIKTTSCFSFSFSSSSSILSSSSCSASSSSSTLSSSSCSASSSSTLSSSSFSAKCWFLDEFGNIPIELQNNMAVLQTTLYQYEDAENTYENLLKTITYIETKIKEASIEKQALFKAIHLIIRFNVALLNEYRGEYSKATSEYKKFNLELPKYVQPWLKRAEIAIQRQDFVAARRYCECAIHHNGQSVYAQLMLAIVYRNLGQIEKACNICVKLLRKSSKREDKSKIEARENEIMYVRTFYAVLLLERARRKTHRASEALCEARLNFYLAARKPHNSNVYAANGLAVIMAQENLTKAAWNSFRVIIESGHTNIALRYSLNRNMAILLSAIAFSERNDIKISQNVNKIDKQKVSKILQHYLVALSCNPIDKEIYLLSGRFLFDLTRFDEAIELLQTAYSMWSHDLIILYDLVVCMDFRLCNDIRNMTKMKEPKTMFELKHICEFIISNLNYLCYVKQQWSFIDNNTIAQLRQGFLPLSTLMLYNGSSSLNILTYPPIGIEHIPQMSTLNNMLTRTRDKILPHILQSLSLIEKSWEEELMRNAQKKEEQQKLRQQQEIALRKVEEERHNEEKRQQELADKLMEEALEIAASLPFKNSDIQELTKSRENNKKKDNEENDFIDDYEYSEDEIGYMQRNRSIENDEFETEEMKKLRKAQKKLKKKKRKKHKKKKNKKEGNEQSYSDNEENKNEFEEENVFDRKLQDDEKSTYSNEKEAKGKDEEEQKRVSCEEERKERNFGFDDLEDGIYEMYDKEENNKKQKKKKKKKRKHFYHDSQEAELDEEQENYHEFKKKHKKMHKSMKHAEEENYPSAETEAREGYKEENQNNENLIHK